MKKCLENGYKVVLDISGGLDSRMIASVVKSLGYNENVIGINYAQDESADQKISKLVAKKFDVNLLQYIMDSGECIKDIDDLIFMNQGFNYYIGITGGRFVLENLDRKNYGAELWGILGDIYEGAMIVEPDITNLDWCYPRFRTSKFYPIRNKDGYNRNYEDNEIMWFYIRGMLAGANTAFIRQNFLEAPGVYGDVEFMDFIFSIPYETRTKGHIYRKWMKKYYPDAYDIVYSGNKIKVCVDDREEALRFFIRRVENKLIKTFNRKYFERTSSMNPIDYWLRNNPSIKEYIDKYFDNHISLLNEFAQLQNELTALYSSDNALDKIVALSMISAIKQYIL